MTPPSDDTRRLAEEIFHQVVDLPPEERLPFLDAHADDPEVRTEVELLLEHDGRGTDGGLEAAPGGLPVLAHWIGSIGEFQIEPLPDATRKLGDFKVIRQIGRGGMGAVYEAIQESLGRRVALKVLPETFVLDPDRLERFRREARATASIHHPNIVPIYEVGDDEGVHFYAMKLIDGPSLDVVLAETKERAAKRKKDAPTSNPAYIRGVLEQTAAVAEGLQEAHAQGLTHRDIKPANILVDASGRWVLGDFGLVRDAKADTITRSGELLGTLNYMSPEQIATGTVGPQTDVYSLGVTLFEMLTLQRPFEGESAPAVQNAILSQDPPSPRKINARLDRDLATILLHCLQKKPERRYASAGALAADLRRFLDGKPILARPQAFWEKASRRAWRHRATLLASLLVLALGSAVAFLAWPRNTSLAILPFVNEGAAPELEALAEGIAESLIFRLAEVPALKVKSKSLVSLEKYRRLEPQAIGRDLGVDAVLAGRVTSHEDGIVVRVELLNVRRSETLWGARYERAFERLDVQTLEEDISRQVVASLRLGLGASAGERVKKRYTEDLEAYLLYRQGRHLWSKYTQEDLQKSIEYFQRAIDRDPRFALAHVGMAEAYIGLGFDFLPPGEAFPRAVRHAQEAERLDPTLGEAHAALGAVRLYYYWDWAEAVRRLNRALELDPRCAESFPCFIHCLDALGRADEALEMVRETLYVVDPDSMPLQQELGCTSYYAGRYEVAIASCLRTLDVEENFPMVLFNLARAYGQVGKFDESIQALEKARALEDANYILAELGYAYGRSGRGAKANEILAELLERRRDGYVDSYILAFVHIGLGEKDEAIQRIEEAYATKSSWIPWLKVEPKFFGLHGDPRFQEMLRGLDLPST